MPDKPFCIFVVDDDELLRMVICDQLAGHDYQIHEFTDGASCLDALDDLNPSLILLDIEMPGQSGLEVCREIRERGFDEIQVMFVSAHDDLETLLAGFDVGGNDFINKNVQKDVLLRKVVIARENEQNKRELKNQLNYARQTAFTAMSSLGETGLVLEFLRSSFHCINFEQLGQLLLQTLQQFNLKGMVKLSDANQEYFFGSDSQGSPLETSILNYVEKFNRIYQANDRLALNFPHISMLVLGLDTSDPDGVGRLRDHLAIVVEAAGVRIDAMAIEQKRLIEANARIAAVKELVELFAKIELHQQKNHFQLENLADQHRLKMEDAFMRLGLTDSQELLLHSIVDELSNGLTVLFEQDSKLALTLSELMQKQKAMLQTQ